MSAPDPVTASVSPGMTLATVAVDILELGAYGGRAPDLAALASSRGITLPAFGRSTVPHASTRVLGVRPDRWLMLTSPAPEMPVAQRCAAASAHAQSWGAATAGIGTAVDLSAGLTALHLGGSALREVLARACRLDLDAAMFPRGAAAATQMVQVSVILVALPSAMLLLTPSTTARHVREWLAATAQPFGFAPRATLGLADIIAPHMRDARSPGPST